MTPGELAVCREHATLLRIRAAKGELLTLAELRWLELFERRERSIHS